MQRPESPDRTDNPMAKKKQQKLKERQKRIAQKKLAAAAKKRTQEKTAKEAKATVPQRSKIMAAAVPTKPDYVPTATKKPFTQRRGGG
jgi:hypothetical protein